jgi:hypothetical protein
MPFGFGSSQVEGTTPIGDWLKRINVETNAIGTAVDGFTGEETADNPVQQSSDTLGKTIQEAIDDVEKQKTVSYATATGLLSIFQSLIPDTKAMLAKFTEKKDLFIKAGLAPKVLESLKAQQISGLALDAKIYSKLPLLAQPLSKGQYSQIDTVLKAAITEWEGYVASA